MKKLIKNGLVITMDENDFIGKKDIVINDNKISDIVDNYDGEYDYVIDAEGKVVMPGLINCHTHLGMSIFRATNDSLKLNEWLNDYIWPIEDNMNDTDAYYTTLISCIEMIKTGTTTFSDMYFYQSGVLKAIEDTKMRGVFARSVTDNDGGGQRRIDEVFEMMDKYKNPLVKYFIAPHALYTCSIPYLKTNSDLARKLNIPVHIHYLEDKDEYKNLCDMYNKKPIEILKETGLLDNKLILAHGTHLTIEDLEEFKGKDVSVVHNPVSNLNLGCGIADIVKYKDYVNVCLGTDGQGSGNNMNLFYHMSFVDLLQKGVYKEPTIMDSYDVLKMATINGAKALNYTDIGSIKIGNKADIIILDVNDVETFPHINIVNDIVHNGYNCVDTTIIDGEVLMENKELKLDIDVSNVKEKVNEIINRLNKNIDK